MAGRNSAAEVSGQDMMIDQPVSSSPAVHHGKVVEDYDSPFLTQESTVSGLEKPRAPRLIAPKPHSAHQSPQSATTSTNQVDSDTEMADPLNSQDPTGGGAAATAPSTEAQVNSHRKAGRPKKNKAVKIEKLLPKGKETEGSSKAASPPSSMDGTAPKIRRNAPRLSATAASVRENGYAIPPLDAVIPELNMLPPSSPQPTTAQSDEYAPLKPYDASPQSVFRPPPSAALAIFNRPPSPSFRLAFKGQKLGEFNSDGTKRSSASASSTSFLSSDPLPLTGASDSLHPLSSAPIDAGPSVVENPAIRATRGSLVSADTSPYAIKKVDKVVRKGKANKSNEKGPGSVPNYDHCDVCGGIGRFLCCDGCPRSFHFMCLDPPLEVDQLPEEEEWFCKQCAFKRRPKSHKAGPKGIFAPLLKALQDLNPKEFKLPDEIRNTFTNVQTRADGAFQEYDAKSAKFDRTGYPEERDGYRLKSKGQTVLCYKCKGSAAPIGPGVAAGVALGRQIVSCDYCSSSWHLDCLDPPPATMPHSTRKWMCPNHAQHLLPKKRTLKNAPEEIVQRTGVRNNGIIEIYDPEAERKRLEFEQAFINGKRYRIPERIVQLDFWGKIGRRPQTSMSDEPKPSAEVLFGGHSPLSTAPSSPETGTARLAGQDPEGNIDSAVYALLGLSKWPIDRSEPDATTLPHATSVQAKSDESILPTKVDQQALAVQDQSPDPAVFTSQDCDSKPVTTAKVDSDSPQTQTVANGGPIEQDKVSTNENPMNNQLATPRSESKTEADVNVVVNGHRMTPGTPGKQLMEVCIPTRSEPSTPQRSQGTLDQIATAAQAVSSSRSRKRQGDSESADPVSSSKRPKRQASQRIRLVKHSTPEPMQRQTKESPLTSKPISSKSDSTRSPQNTTSLKATPTKIKIRIPGANEISARLASASSHAETAKPTSKGT